MKYRYVLFDADDTLLDYAKSEVVALQKLFEKHGLYCSDDIKKVFANLCDTLWSEFGLNNTTDSYVSSHYHEIYYEYSAKRFETLISFFSIPVPVQKLSNEYIEELSECNYLTDGAYEICRNLAVSCKICVITNGLWMMQKKRFERSRVGRFISSIIVSENARYAKPSPMFFEYALKESEVFDKSATLVVGDSLINDIYGASSFGIDTCWFNNQNCLNQTKVVPTYEIRDLRELEHVFN